MKALGNAWVPQVAYEIFRAIAQVEKEQQIYGTGNNNLLGNQR